MLLYTRTLQCVTIAGALILSATANASEPNGVWFDHNGRGAVEISPCANGNGLCGYVVHVQNDAHADRCGLQILGNVTSGGGGWIYSPERKRKYPVSLKRLSDGTLRVVGNAGSMFSRTFTWNPAPDSISRCGETVAAAPEAAEPETTAPAVAESQPHAKASESAPDEPPVLIGASSGAVALLAAPRARIAETEPSPAAAPVEAPVQPASVSSKTPVAEDTVEVEPERTCKFRIPYVGRVIDIPCRD